MVTTRSLKLSGLGLLSMVVLVELLGSQPIKLPSAAPSTPGRYQIVLGAESFTRSTSALRKLTIKIDTATGRTWYLWHNPASAGAEIPPGTYWTPVFAEPMNTNLSVENDALKK